MVQKFIDIKPFSTLSLKNNVECQYAWSRYQTRSKKVSHTWGVVSFLNFTFEPPVWPCSYSKLIQLVLKPPLGVTDWSILRPWYKVTHLVPFKLTKLLLHCSDLICFLLLLEYLVKHVQSLFWNLFPSLFWNLFFILVLEPVSSLFCSLFWESWSDFVPNWVQQCSPLIGLNLSHLLKKQL